MVVKLTEEEKDCVKKWLWLDRKDKPEKCPFSMIMDGGCPDDNHKLYPICVEYFPKIKVGTCPCNEYTIKTVIDRAKKMIGES